MLVIILVVLLLIFIIYVSRYFFGSHLNILSIFASWWYFSLIIALINLENFYRLSLFSVFLFTITPVIITFGSMCSSILLRIRPIKNLSLTPYDDVKFSIIDKILSISLLVLVSIIVSLMYTVSVSLNLDLQSLRDLMWSAEAANFHPIFTVLTPIKWLSEGILLYLILKQIYIAIYLKLNNNFYYLFLNTLSYVALNLSGGGRGAVLNVIILEIREIKFIK